MENTTGTGAPAPASTPSAAPAAASSATSGAAPSTPVSTQPSPSAGASETGSVTPSSEVPENVSTTEFLASKLRDGFGIDKNGNPKPEQTNDLSSDDGSIDDSAAATGEDGQLADGTQEAAGENAFDFDTIGFTGAKDLNDQIAADPALNSALEANPELKARFFANARLAERANKYDEIAGSPDEAQVMSQGYVAFSNLGEHMAAIEDGNFQTMTPFMESLKEQTALRDENGEIRRYPDGSMMTDGSVGKFLKTFFHERLEILTKQAQQNGNDDLLAALDTVMESAGLRGPSSAHEDEPEELQEQRASLEQERKALDDRQKAQFTADLNASDARVDSKTDTVLEGAMKSILDSANGLDQFSRTTLENNIRKELSQFIRGSVSYRNQRAAIERMPLGPAREARVVQLNTRFVNENLRRIATKAVASAGVSIQTKTQQRQDRQAARVEASKSDTNSAMSQVAPGSSAAEHASIPKIEADLRAKLGREASIQEVLAERMTRMRPAPATR